MAVSLIFTAHSTLAELLSHFLHVNSELTLLLCWSPLSAELSICPEGCPPVWISALRTISQLTYDSLGSAPEAGAHTSYTASQHQVPTESVHADISEESAAGRRRGSTEHLLTDPSGFLYK